MAMEFSTPIALKELASRLGCDTSTVYKWRKLGRKNPYTGDRIYPEFTWLPTGEWGMTQDQFDAFLASLNQKP